MSKTFVAVALGLMLLKVYTWAVVLRPHSRLLLNSLYCTTTGLMFWSYGQVWCSRPLTKRPLDSHTPPPCKPSSRYCDRCDAAKAINVHHCSTCDRCVYRMDHHCPWTANCVAWTNKKCFVLFLLYTSLSCWTFTLQASQLLGHPMDTLPTQQTYLLKSGWLATLGLGSLLAGYFVFHLWLLREGKTTLEFLTGQPGELANCSFRHNVTVYFGRNVWTYWLPTAPMLDAALGKKAQDRPEPLSQLVITH